MKRFATIALFLFAFGAGQAQANTPQEDQMLSAASAYWGTEQSCPASSITVQRTSTGGATAEAMLGGCDYPDPIISLSASLTFAAVSECMVIAHEYGHLIRLEHSPDSHSVMYEGGPWYAPVIPGCHQFLFHRKHRKHHRH